MNILKRLAILLVPFLIASGASATIQKLPAGETIFTKVPTDGMTVSRNRVGIRTDNPQYTLDVNGTSNALEVLKGGLPVGMASDDHWVYDATDGYWTVTANPWWIGTNQTLWLDNEGTEGIVFSSYGGGSYWYGTRDKYIETNNSSTAHTRPIGLSTGAGSSGYNSGELRLKTGTAAGAKSGDVSLYTGSAGEGESGKIQIYTGSGYGPGGIDIYTGLLTDSPYYSAVPIRIYTGNSGNVEIQNSFRLDTNARLLNDFHILAPYPSFIMENDQIDGARFFISDQGPGVQIGAEQGALTDERYLNMYNPVVLSRPLHFGLDNLSGSYVSMNWDGTDFQVHSLQGFNVLHSQAGVGQIISDDGHRGLYSSPSWTGFWGSHNNLGLSQVYIDGNGEVTIEAATATGGTSPNGPSVFIRAGQGVTGTGGQGGNVDINYGWTDGSSPASGYFQVSGSGSSGSGAGMWAQWDSVGMWTDKGHSFYIDDNYGVQIYTANESAGSDPVAISSGSGGAGDSGDISLTTGGSSGGTRGEIFLDAPTVNVSGVLLGNVVGNLTGTADIALVANSCVGDVTGNVVGNVLGNLTGDVDAARVTISTQINFANPPDTISEVLVSADRQVTVNIGGTEGLLYFKAL